MSQKTLRIEISNERVKEYKRLMDDSDKSAWHSIETKHLIGRMLREDKETCKHGKFREVLQMIAQNIGRSWQDLLKCKRFADMYPNLEEYKAAYANEERASSWHFICKYVLFAADDTITTSFVNNSHTCEILRNPQNEERNHEAPQEQFQRSMEKQEEVSESLIEPKFASYDRTVINWPHLERDNPRRFWVMKTLKEVETEYHMSESDALEEALYYWLTTAMRKAPPMKLNEVAKEVFQF